MAAFIKFGDDWCFSWTAWEVVEYTPYRRHHTTYCVDSTTIHTIYTALQYIPFRPHYSTYCADGTEIHAAQTARQYIPCRRHFVLGLRTQKSRWSVRRFSEEREREKKKHQQQLSLHSRGILRTQKLRPPSFKNQRLFKVPLRFGVGQNITSHISPAARNFTLQTSTSQWIQLHFFQILSHPFTCVRSGWCVFRRAPRNDKVRGHIANICC